MDNKIIAAIIIAVGFVVGVYMYTSTTPFNRCMSAWKEINTGTYGALEQCKGYK
jgi:hypothetical protein